MISYDVDPTPQWWDRVCGGLVYGLLWVVDRIEWVIDRLQRRSK